MSLSDREILRDLAKRYRDLCADSVQAERRDLWRRHNSLQRTRPLIYVRAFAWQEMPEAACLCRDPFFRATSRPISATCAASSTSCST